MRLSAHRAVSYTHLDVYKRQLLNSVRATDGFFQVFGVAPLLGRTFMPGEDQDGKNDILVLSYGAWQRYFGGDRGVLGHTVKVDGANYVVIGVMPDGFSFGSNHLDQVFFPLHLSLIHI